MFTSIYKNQILSLVIDINTNGEVYTTKNINKLLFSQIFTTFSNLQSLIFCPSLIHYQYLFFDIFPSTIVSSALLELHVCLNNFRDCLYLLDERFNQLRIFHVNIAVINLASLTFNNKKKLPNLRSFKLSSDNITDGYDELILPLLHRMSNLHELNLSLFVWTTETFVDGNNLKISIINHMGLLNKFTFNIVTTTSFYNQTNLPSNDYIQETFKDFENKQIISSVDYFQQNKSSQCHIYSYPYQLKDYDNITNNFPGGIFISVRRVSLFDERPFEHEFFLRIAQSFPFMEKLTLINNKRQNNKQFGKSKYRNQDLSIIQYPYLIELDLCKAQKDYYEQFLFDTKTCLPNNICVNMDYRLVKKVTRNFRRNTTRSNCAKMVFIHFRKKSKFPEHLKDYFPHARIC
ncbi:unnamed protein product [Rotaria sp. Silwood2]|nr:unnamed protein product [Rotaria sp. Silwood2]